MSNSFTFIAWSDTHFGYDDPMYDNPKLKCIEDMTRLAGWPYPQEIGGAVKNPDFLVNCGDVVDGPHPICLEHYEYAKKLIPFPSYEVLGNHDLANERFKQGHVEKYGSLNYSFNHKGVHFISLCVEKYTRQSMGSFLEPHTLEWLDRDLQKISPSTPTVLMLHPPIHWIENQQDLLTILQKHHLILIMYGHTHKPNTEYWHGTPCINIGCVRRHPIDREYARSIHVVNISNEQVMAIPWRWDLGDWERGQGRGEGQLVENYIQHVRLIHPIEARMAQSA